MTSTFTPNRGYNNQATGDNPNTWGTVVNANFTTIDSNLGGTLSISVAGNSNVTLSSSQAQNLIHNLTGILTGNINYIFPAAGGFFSINNGTTGSFTVTVTVVGGSGGVLIPQGTTQNIYIDASVPVVNAYSGTQYVYYGNTVGGTANAITISQTLPTNFTLNTGNLLTFTPPSLNTAATTLAINGGAAKTVKKLGASGIIDLQPGDIGGFPLICQYNGTVWIALNVIFIQGQAPITKSGNFTLDFSYWVQPIICTSALTITLTQTTSTAYYFNCYVSALGGAVTITPNAADTISVNGATGAAGVGFTLPQGCSARLYTDATSKWYVDYYLSPLSAALTGTPTAPTAAQSTNTTQIATTAFFQGSAASKAQMQTGTSATVFSSPSQAQSHPSAAKAWVYFTVSGTTVTVAASYNVASVTRSGVGAYTVNFTTSFTSANYATIVTSGVNTAASRFLMANFTSPATGSVGINFQNPATNSSDEPSQASVICYGAQ